MKPEKLFSLLVMTALLAYGAAGYYFLPYATFQGDLTRVGMLPETLFGWRKPQPLVPGNLLIQSSIDKADVLVIGDSFSAGLVWQSVLVKQGIKVRTLTWDTVRGACEDIGEKLRKLGFRGRYIVFEVIERNLLATVERSLVCKEATFHLGPNDDAPRAAMPTNFDPDHLARTGKLSVGFKTLLNERNFLAQASATQFSKFQASHDVTVARVTEGCHLLSHTACEYILHLAEESAEDISPSVLDNIAALNSRLPGVTTLWAVVPNKSTVYLYSGKTFWDRSKRYFHSVNLLDTSKEALKRGAVDLYPANNTHYSQTGYLVMGDAILHDLKSIGLNSGTPHTEITMEILPKE